MYFRVVISYTVMLDVGCATTFCSPQVGKLARTTPISSGTNRSSSEDIWQSVVGSLLQDFGVGHCADTPVIIILYIAMFKIIYIL